jgi:hypothetical protein
VLPVAIMNGEGEMIQYKVQHSKVLGRKVSEEELNACEDYLAQKYRILTDDLKE